MHAYIAIYLAGMFFVAGILCFSDTFRKKSGEQNSVQILAFIVMILLSWFFVGAMIGRFADGIHDIWRANGYSDEEEDDENDHEGEKNTWDLEFQKKFLYFETMKWVNKYLVVVTRSDLAPEQRAVQSVHAAINFVFEHPARASPWFHNSNYLLLRQTPDKESMRRLIWKAEELGIACTPFREPDLENALTAIAFEPSEQTDKLTSKLKLLSYENSRKKSPQDDGN